MVYNYRKTEILTLEEITNLLLNEEISIEESVQLCKKIKKEKKQENDDYKIFIGDNSGSIIAYDDSQREIGFLDYYQFIDNLKKNAIIIERVQSYEQNIGVFKKMFKELKRYSLKNNIHYFLLEVNNSNINAIEIYKHYNFQFTNSPEIIPLKSNLTSWMILPLEDRL
ncbi:MAG: GNAT family N-acetyltransferase [Candidatus Nanoarchaeia archaeon]|nr:GNAT family N-acetyltransferase [Candidatus Nanoarchaeia archaeon]